MTALVIDSSVAVKWSFRETHSEAALKVFEWGRSGRFRLLAPDLFASEVANVIWKKHALRGEIDKAQAEQGLALILTACPDLIDSRLLVQQAFHLATAHRRSVYDCLYVALALREKCDFVTADERLVNALSPAVSGILSLGNI